MDHERFRDANRCYPPVAAALDIPHENINASAGEQVRDVVHIQTVNSRQNQIVGFLRVRRGIATKYLDSYLRWFHLIALGDQSSPRARLEAAMTRLRSRQRPRNRASPHPPPVEALEESLELGLAEPHHTVLDPGSGEAALLETFVGRNKPAPVPRQGLQSVTSLGAEDNDHTGIDVQTQLPRCRRGQSVMATAKINRPRRHHDAERAVGQNHHARPRPEATATIRSTGLSTGRRTTTPCASIATD